MRRDGRDGHHQSTLRFPSIDRILGTLELAPARTCDSRLLATPSPAVGLNIPFPITYLQVMNLDLTDEETAALTRLLSQTIDANRYPLSPRIQTLKAILAKIRPEPKREPLPPLKHYEPAARDSSQKASLV